MKIKSDGIVWPTEWEVSGSVRNPDIFWVGVDLDSYRIYRSAGNESLWYVEMYSPIHRDITGQCTTLIEAIGNLRRYLAGESVPDGDEITVLIEGREPITAPVYHDHFGARSVCIPKEG